MTMPNFSSVVERYLEGQPVGRLATSTPDGVPHVAALCYGNDQDLLYINTDSESKKGRNISNNSKVAFIVDEYLSWEKNRGVIILGEAEFKTNGPLFRRGRDLIYSKYPKWKQAWPIEENESDVLVIRPTNVIDWGLT